MMPKLPEGNNAKGLKELLLTGKMKTILIVVLAVVAALLVWSWVA